MSRFEDTMNCIFSHQWEQQPLKLSHIRLVEEFRYLVTLWLDTAGIRRSQWSFNLPMIFGVDHEDLREEYFAAQRHVGGVDLFLKACLSISVLWAYGEDVGLIPKWALPDPYEPMLVLYERGGNIHLHSDHGIRHFVISGTDRYVNMSHRFWPHGEDAPLLSLDKAYLDKLDEQPIPQNNRY